ncbi:hypothetical protein ACMFMG_012177 [Clarireedia jacksonii]
MRMTMRVPMPMSMTIPPMNRLMALKIQHHQRPALFQPLRQPRSRQSRIAEMMKAQAHNRDIKLKQILLAFSRQPCIPRLHQQVPLHGNHLLLAQALVMRMQVVLRDHGAAEIDANGAGDVGEEGAGDQTGAAGVVEKFEGVGLRGVGVGVGFGVGVGDPGDVDEGENRGVAEE